MAEGPVLVIASKGGDDAVARVAHIRASHPVGLLVLLAGAEVQPGLKALADEVWMEGGRLGPKRFLALLRRISWMGFAVIYDLDGSFVSRFMRLCVWPRTRWVDLSL